MKEAKCMIKPKLELGTIGTYVKNNFKDWARKLGILYLYGGTIELYATLLSAYLNPNKFGFANFPIHGGDPSITLALEVLPLLTLGGYAIYREAKDIRNGNPPYEKASAKRTVTRSKLGKDIIEVTSSDSKNERDVARFAGFITTSYSSVSLLGMYILNYLNGVSTHPVYTNVIGETTAEGVWTIPFLAFGTYYLIDEFIVKRRKNYKDKSTPSTFSQKLKKIPRVIRGICYKFKAWNSLKITEEDENRVHEFTPLTKSNNLKVTSGTDKPMKELENGLFIP